MNIDGKGDDNAHLYFSLHGKFAAKKDDQDQAGVVEKIHKGAKNGIDLKFAFTGLVVLGVVLIEVVDELLFLIKNLNGLHAAEILIERCVDLGEFHPDVTVGVAHFLLKNKGDKNQKGHNAKGNQAELDIHAHHHEDTSKDNRNIA